MHFINDKIQNYSELMSQAEPEYLSQIARYTHTQVLRPRMLSGHLQGRFLSFLSAINCSKYILEIGTYTGYSTLCLAEGLADEGKVYTLEKDEEFAYIAQNFFNEFNKADKVELLLGDAANTIQIANAKVPHWDFIWIDADKKDYKTYFELCFSHLRVGGIMLIDNVLWSGKVVNDTELEDDEETKAIHEFNSYIAQNSNVQQVLLPIRDGIMMLRKL